MVKLPDNLLTLIWEYDSTYKVIFDEVLDEWKKLLILYDNLFWENNRIKRNVWKSLKSVDVWINKYGINYNPNYFIINYVKRGKKNM